MKEKASKGHRIHSYLNMKVRVVTSSVQNAGKGLIAKDFIAKKDFICTYGGTLVDAADAPYASPIYMVNFENGRGPKLNGDDLDGDGRWLCLTLANREENSS